MSQDKTSLQNLNDIVMPPQASWWPLAPGWYVVGVVVLLLLAWLAVRYWNEHKRNRYRRAALQKLLEIRRDRSEAALRSLPELLKRTVLSAWPREEVAALSGPAWHEFLDRTAKMKEFSGPAGTVLDQLAYAGKTGAIPLEQDVEAVLNASEAWMNNHRKHDTKS